MVAFNRQATTQCFNVAVFVVERDRGHRTSTSPTPTSDPILPIPVLSKDLSINQSNKHMGLIIPCPQSTRSHFPHQQTQVYNKLPLIICFHGSGFTYYSAASTVVHDFCSKMAEDVDVVVASLDYWLAPDHRLRQRTRMSWRFIGSKPFLMNG